MQLTMDDFEYLKSNKQEIILSLQEEYFNKIITGKKKNEYRFNFVKNKTKAYIYLPKDKQCIIGSIDLGMPEWCSVEDAAKIYSKSGDGDYNVMLDWLKGRNGCYVIPIEGFKVYDIPINKEILKQCNDFIAPQTYTFLKNRPNLQKLLNEKENQTIKPTNEVSYVK